MSANTYDARVPGHSVTVLGAALVALVFGFAFAATAPMGADAVTSQRWFLAHNSVFHAFKVCGLLLLIGGVLLQGGRPRTLRWVGWLMGLFAALMAIKAVTYIALDIVTQSFDIFSAVTLILAGIGFIETRQLLQGYQGLQHNHATGSTTTTGAPPPSA